MVKHTQTIRRLLPTNYLSVFDHFVRLALNGLNRKRNYLNYTKVTFSVFNWLVWAINLLFFEILVLVTPAFSAVAFKLRIMSVYLATLVFLHWSFQVASKRDYQGDNKSKILNISKISRASHRRCSMKKGVLKIYNFANFTGKHLRWSLFLIRFQVRPTTLLKRNSNTRMLTELHSNVFRPFGIRTYSASFAVRDQWFHNASKCLEMA